MSAEPDRGAAARGPLLRLLLVQLRPYWGVMAAGAFLALLDGAAGGLIAWLVKPVMDNIFVKHDRFMLEVVPIAIVAIYVAKALAGYGEAYLMASVGERVVAGLRRELRDHIQGMPLSFFSSRHSGELRARVVNDVTRVAGLAEVFVNTVRRIVTIAALLSVMLMREWTLALLAAAVFPAAGVVIWALGRALYRINRRAQERMADLFVLLQESFTGAKIVKAFGREQLEQARFDRLNDRLLQLALRDVRVDQLSSPLMEVLAAIGMIGVLWYGGGRVVAGALTPGEFFSFMAAVVLLYRPVRELLRTLNTVQQSLSSLERVFEVLDTPPSIVDAPGAVVLDNFRDRIAFEDVCFRYPDSESDTLHHVSLTIRRGETVAVVGLSGAGKSTLMDLLPRFHDATAGRITVDGHDVRHVTVASLRGLIGLVTQDTFLFRETLEYNIAYGKPGASRAEVEWASRMAHAHEFIAPLPEGYATATGERGVKLSGGQRQRIAIARAFLKNPPILILDEATSDLDAETELLVQQALSDLMAGRTVLVIAHRLATVRGADRVVVVDGGRIVEAGRHEELMARAGGLYRRLATLQMLDVGGR
ncbi:MAG TPA: ABC transporter ATP-binding protein [Candidatus Methylomirabilis sp.]|nr:ABC transporter ATP-binding protein [Candidatus Methylomirabilis sp.]